MKIVFMLSLALTLGLVAQAQESPDTLDQLQVARCNLISGKVNAACSQLGKIRQEITAGNRAEIAPVFSYCYSGGDARNTADQIEKFLRASDVIASTCN